jgi:hypothetical protein
MLAASADPALVVTSLPDPRQRRHLRGDIGVWLDQVYR